MRNVRRRLGVQSLHVVRAAGQVGERLMVLRQEGRRPDDGEDSDGDPKREGVEAVEVPFGSSEYAIVSLRELANTEDASNLPSQRWNRGSGPVETAGTVWQ